MKNAEDTGELRSHVTTVANTKPQGPSQGRVLPQPDGHMPQAQEPDTPSGEVITCEFP